MKYRINEGQNTCDGSVIYRIYKGENDKWVLITAEGTLEKARATVERLKNPKPEVTVEEIDA